MSPLSYLVDSGGTLVSLSCSPLRCYRQYNPPQKAPPRTASPPRKTNKPSFIRTRKKREQKSETETQHNHIRCSRSSFRCASYIASTDSTYQSAWYLANLSAVSFLLSSTAVSLRPLPPSPFPWMPPTTDMRRSLLSFAPSSCETRATENEAKE